MGAGRGTQVEVKPFGIDVIIIEPAGIKTEFGKVVIKQLDSIPSKTTYGKHYKKISEFINKNINTASDPIVIAKTISKAIKARRLKTR